MSAINEVSISNKRRVPLDINGHPIEPESIALDAIGVESGVAGGIGVIIPINWAEKSRLRRIFVKRTSGSGKYTVRILSAPTVDDINTIYEETGINGMLDMILDLVCVNTAGKPIVYLQILPGSNGNFEWRLTGNAMV